ncbi:hypothetical protein TTHERM_01287970 (macronuclear) [Tetrahymena thermophila SB210]|uniref:Leucine rich repeat protein n=1 Tax=Tetrahymena thermophila (strain SB210) TaxID=312017 RepID=Q24BD5_TETTS|nr:hypothetical protein TTHERM_01287970 [Tetrahymena thermophila SB210]EAS05094.2 hypothetical protein TTHERM_01287970 [Tetrahymena thermophila SB210]|eukprot:XP_001025339.2 hypothetical protein TTHERM_01287970 [Tetrahymena thermophila SB210]
MIFQQQSQLQRNNSGVITQLTLDEINRIYDSRKKIDLKKLEFQSDNYKLVTINGISQFPNLAKVSHINLESNELKNINELSEFPELEYLNASYNKIESYELKTPKLKKLYLSHNYIKQIFHSADYFLNLIVLDVSHNNITLITEEQIIGFKVLKKFYFQHNKVQFRDSSVLHQLLIGLSQLQNLEEVNALNNPFIDTYKSSEWPNRLAYYMMTENLRALKINELEYKPSQYNTLLKNLKNLENMYDGKKKPSKNVDEKDIIQVQDMVDQIENCNNNPVQCFTYLQRLSEDVDKLIQNPLNWTKTFFSKIPVEQISIRKQIDEFLQNCLLFLNTQQSHAKNLLYPLAKMTKITTNDFGQKCFEVINEVAKTSDRSQSDLKKILREICFKYTYKRDLEKVPLHVIRGLIETVKIFEEPFIHNQVHLSRVNCWLDQMVVRYSQNTFVIQNNIYQIDESILEFLSLICKEPEKVKLFCKKTTNEFLDENFGKNEGQNMIVTHDEEEEQDKKNNEEDERNDQQEEDENEDNQINFFDRLIYLFSIIVNSKYSTQYINCLQIFYNACQCDEEVGQKVAEQFLNTRSKNINFMQILEDEIANYLRILKQGNNTLNDGQKSISKEELANRYLKFSELIKTYGAIYHYHEFKKKELQEQSGILHDLLLIVSLEFVDPILLAAICEFTRNLLDNKTIVQNKENLNTIKSKTQKLGQLLSYLGDTKYEQLCKYLGLNAVNLMHQNDERIQSLIREIVLLFKWFSEKQTKWQNQNQGEKKKQDFELEYESVSSFLEQQGRENNLFKCLAIPNDDVRLVIVECLMTMPIEQWKSQQICVLFNIANGYKSLGAGKTEKVLSNIFMIASKFCILSDEKKSKDFEIIYAENSVLDVQKVLLIDMERDLREDPDEEQEKIELAIACVNFLISLSAKFELRKLAKSQQIGTTLKKVLLLEEEYLPDSAIPIEIERTWAGRFLHYILPILQGKDSLYPYSYISFRILCRIADNLQRKGEEQAEDLKEFDYLYKYEEIYKKKYKRFQERKSNELKLWDQLKEIEVQQDQSQLYLDDVEYAKEIQQVMNCNLIQVLINFLIGNNQSQKSMVLESDLKMQFQELQLEYEFKEQMLSIIYKLRDKIFHSKTDQIDDLELDLNFKKGELSKKDRELLYSKSHRDLITKGYILLHNEIDEQKIQDHLDQAIQQPIVSAQQYNMKNASNVKKQFLHQDHAQEELLENFEEEKVKKKSKKSKLKNIRATSQVPKKLRVLMVSSLLRCIYALCINSDKQTKKQITTVLEAKANIKNLTCLCDWAGWSEGNIAAKYLWIINFILDQSQESRKIEYIYNYEIIAKVCHRITKIIERKLLEDEKSPISEDDKIIMKELCSALSTMMQNICKFNWNSLITDEGNPDDKKDSTNKKIDKLPKEELEQFLLKCNLICTETLLLKILPFQQFKTFISIACFFMKSSTEFAKKVESPLEISTRELVMISLSNLIGTYICGINSKRQDVMRIFTYAEVFEKKVIRKSYLQNILDICSYKSFEFILEKIIEAENKQEGRSNKLLCAFHIHYRDVNMGKYQNGFLVRLKQDIRIYKYDRNTFLNTLESADISLFKKISRVRFIRESDIDECLTAETHQRIILKMGSEFLNVLFLNEKQGDIFLRTIKNKTRKDTFIAEALAYRLNSINQKDKGAKNQQQHIKNYLQWVCVNPELPQDRDNETNIQNKTLILLDNQQILFFQENQKHWIYLQNREGMQLELEQTNNTPAAGKSKKSKSQSQVSIYNEQQLNKIQNYFQPVFEPIKINSQIKQVIYDQTIVTQVMIKTAKVYKLLFMGDEERENFRSHMILRINNLTKWNQRFDKVEI